MVLFFRGRVSDTCFIKTKENSFTRRIGNQQLANPSPGATTIRTVLHEHFLRRSTMEASLS